ncbi:MAG TPA: serine hydrolase [Propionibacteriaceae bacterium]|nr:serine hydrolase [Propionibacteriaceae bacterium]
MVSEPLMSGFPPPAESRVTLANWQDPPYNRWSFQHVRELIPTQRISRGTGPWRDLPQHSASPALDDVTVYRLAGHTSSFAEVIAETWTDAVVLLHDGQIVYEQYLNAMTEETPHLLMSVTKSVVGCIAGILVEQGLLWADDQVSNYVPEIVGSGYDGATVRHLLNMRTGVAFREEYANTDAEVRVMERYMGWRPREEHDEARGMYFYLTKLGSDTDHGGPFVYRSADTDMLGWVCERAAGTRMADLISLLIWQPMGAEFEAEITCDSVGSAIHDGGMSARARDLARFGQLVLEDGYVHDTSIVPERWLSEARTLDSDIRGAFAASESEAVLPGGWYRSQFWFAPGPLGDLQLCLGIHGQMVLVDRATRTVSVKLSSWPPPQDSVMLIDAIRAFVAAGRHLAGLAGSADARSVHRPIGLIEGGEHRRG